MPNPRILAVPRGLFSFTLLIGLLTCQPILAQTIPHNSNLLINGDAEAGSTYGWLTRDIKVVTAAEVEQSGFTPADSFGNYSFATYLNLPSPQAMMQRVDISSIGSEIDGNGLRATFSGAIGSNSTDRRFGNAYLRELDKDGAPIVVIPLFDTSASSDQSGWMYSTAIAPVIRQTRFLEIFLINSNLSGIDAYFDNFSLVLSAVPEPRSSLLSLLGLLTLGLMVRIKTVLISPPQSVTIN